MKPYRRHIALFSLLLSAALPVLLSVSFLLRLHQAEKEQHQHSTQTIRLNASGLHWIKPGKEIKIGNQLFDVEEIRQDGADILLTGHFDAKENKLMGQAGKMMKMPDARPVFSLPAVFNDFHYIICPLQPNLPVQKKTFPGSYQLPDSPCLAVPTPPPPAC